MMKSTSLASLALALALARATPVKRDSPQGIDVSDNQGSNLDWTTIANNGIQFAYIKATEGIGYTSPSFSPQYTGATNAGLIRGPYHFATPDSSSGADQANYFLQNGGGWSADGITLPGAVDLETYPGSDQECYGLSPSDMVSWIADFSNTYQSATGRYPVIYTRANWWNDCTGSNGDFAANNPLWLADWATSIGALPAGWGYTSFWQYADSGPNPGDADLWNGDFAGLQKFAKGS